MIYIRNIIFLYFISFYLYADNDISIKSSGNTVLHEAILDNNLTKVKEVIKRNDIDIDDTNYNGQTALHLAVINNHIEIVKFLIQKNSTLTKFDSYNFSPLYYAEYHRYIEIYNILIINGAKEKIKKVKKKSLDQFMENFDIPTEESFFEEEIEDKSNDKNIYKNKGYLKW